MTTANGIYLELRGGNLFYLTIDDIGLVFTFTDDDNSWGLNVPWYLNVDQTEGLCGKFIVFCST